MNARDRVTTEGIQGGIGQPSIAEYDVRWVIDITAPDPVEAAREAQRIRRDSGSWATVFVVTELGGPGAQWRVDLDDPESGAEVLRTREEAQLVAGTGLDTATGPGDPGAPANIRALRDALAGARRALAGDSNDAEHDALCGLAEAAAAFLGDDEEGHQP
jgi:hypothetical protein